MLTRLFEHMAWADEKARDAVRRMPHSAPELTRATALYAHVFGAEHVWLARLFGRVPDYPVWPTLGLDVAARLASEIVREYQAFAAGLDAEGLAREVAYTNSAGRAFRDRTDDILIHVALHGTYHRGQIALLTRDGGGEPASTDYIAFVRGAPAATRA
jgi:uncharacterized damage-inducible protein DinB